MTHVQTLSHNQQDIQAYEENAKRLQAERQKKIKQIQESIVQIHKEQAGLTASLGKVEAEIQKLEEDFEKEKKAEIKEKIAIKQRRNELIEERIDTLETERRSLLVAKAQLEEEARNDLGTLNDQLRNLEQKWQKRDFEKRRSLLNFLIREVVIDIVSTHWVRIQVLWLHEEWGREQMYYKRNIGGRRDWTKEEEALLREYYATMHREPLQQLLPDRTWESIRYYGGTTLGIVRDRTDAGKPGRKREHIYPDTNTSYSDLQFRQEKGIPEFVRCTTWERLLAR